MISSSLANVFNLNFVRFTCIVSVQLYITGNTNDLTYSCVREFSFNIDNRNAFYSWCSSRFTALECWQPCCRRRDSWCAPIDSMHSFIVIVSMLFFSHSHTWRLAPLCTFNYDFTSTHAHTLAASLCDVYGHRITTNAMRLCMRMTHSLCQSILMV